MCCSPRATYQRLEELWRSPGQAHGRLFQPVRRLVGASSILADADNPLHTGDRMAGRSGRIRAGMGGWNYEPWRQTFYPGDVTKKGELAYASRQVTAIEVNGTFYRLQTPAVFAKWRDETPDDFVFTLKAPRFITNRRVLREAEAFVPRFLASGLSELGPKLGPILWQLAPTKAFEPDDVAGFLRLLPKELDGLRLRHAFEVRHDSFMTADYLALARAHGVATVFADTDEHPSFADVTGDFVYARLRRTVSSEQTGYTKEALRAWAERARTWADGSEPADLPRVAKPGAKTPARDVYMFFISGAKERAPAAAMHLLSLLDKPIGPKTARAARSRRSQ
jgi:uncharacterized protein YecE (DUF72 family)